MSHVVQPAASDAHAQGCLCEELSRAANEREGFFVQHVPLKAQAKDKPVTSGVPAGMTPTSALSARYSLKMSSGRPQE